MGSFSYYLETGRLLESVMDESIHDKHLFKSVFMAGGTGSGKSYISDLMFKGMPVKVVNPDDIIPVLFKKSNLPLTMSAKDKDVYDKQMALRNKAKKFTETKQGHWINGMLPIIIDGTGKDYDKIKRSKDLLEEIGYDTSMVYVNTSLDVATKRNVSRERTVDTELARRIWEDAQKNIGKFQELFGEENFIIIDNSKDLTSDEIEKLKVKLVRAGMKLLHSPLKNRNGINIIEKLKETGGSYISDLNKGRLK
jgi:dephospho-CoA kinase